MTRIEIDCTMFSIFYLTFFCLVFLVPILAYDDEKVKFIGKSNSAASYLAQVMINPFSTYGAQVSESCENHVELFQKELNMLSPWALNMYDAGAKIPSGLLTGNINQLGQTDQCLRKVNGPFKTHHCLANIIFHIWNASAENDQVDLILGAGKASDIDPNWDKTQSATYRWAFCIPESCNIKDLSSSLQAALKPLEIPEIFNISIQISENNCVKEDGNEKWDTGDFVCLAIIVIILLIVMLSSAIGYYFRSRQKFPFLESTPILTPNLPKYLTSFDLYIHWNALGQRTGADSSVKCIDGIRFLTMCWLIFGHTFYMYCTSQHINLADVARLGDPLQNMIILNSTLTTDSFFLIGGAMAACSLLRRKNINFLKIYLNRYIRLTPAYAFVVLFYATLFRRLSSGLLWNETIGINSQFCQDNWWGNLLYINTFLNIGTMCMSHSWYLSADMQIFICLPLFFFVIKKNSRLGLFLVLLALFGSIISSWVITSLMNLQGAMIYLGNPETMANIYIYIYTQFYTRCGPYLIGVFLGYLLHYSNAKSIYKKCNLCQLTFLWIFFMGISLLALFGVWPMYNNYDFGNILNGMYASLYRNCWSLGVAWIIFTCANNSGGPITAILHWELWNPLSKLTYSSYLVHFIILLVNSSISRSPTYFNMYGALREAIANTFITLIFALILYLCIEAPFSHLIKLLLTEKKPISKSQEILISNSTTTISEFNSANNLILSK